MIDDAGRGLELGEQRDGRSRREEQQNEGAGPRPASPTARLRQWRQAGRRRVDDDRDGLALFHGGLLCSQPELEMPYCPR